MDRVVRRSMSLAQLRSRSAEVSASNIRKSFMDYFCEDNQHLHVRSSPVFSLLDPTLAFVNAGMNQFKDVFLGSVRPASTRVANSQKCIRIGGKHNDLLQVGKDGTHHTFFEMLGNWSFGDYFKEKACAMSWDLLTKVYELPPERLYVTYFGGDDTLGLGADVEVEEIWRRIGVEKSHILPFGLKDNFWEMGPTGPCGPCTEIHYDHVPERRNVGELVNRGRSDLTELWNLVFIQYNRSADGALEALGNHFVDTGMGFERLVAVLQGKTSNYDTDLFRPLFRAIEKHSGHSGYAGKYDGNAVDCGYRILADHARMLAVAFSDGMIPNQQNKVRLVMRKAYSVSEKVFGARPGMLKELTNRVADTLSDAYPQIGKNLPKIKYIIDCEEELIESQRKNAAARWKKIKKEFPGVDDLDVVQTPHLLAGLDYMKKNYLDQGRTMVEAKDVWVLYDTLGVPVDVARELFSNLGLQFDMSSYEKYVETLKATGKETQHEQVSKMSTVIPPRLSIELEKKNLKPTTNYFKHDYRIGNSGKYLFREQPSTVEAIIVGDVVVEKLTARDVQDGEKVGLVLDRSQMLSKRRNQESDSGKFLIENGITFNIESVVETKGVMIHFGTFDEFPRDAAVRVRSNGVVRLDEDRRLALMRNNTGLHLLNAAFRNLFPATGEKKSTSAPEKLQLTVMMYQSQLGLNDIKKIEKFVKDFILYGVPVTRRIYNHEKFQMLDDVVFLPGEPIVEQDIPVVDINSGFYVSRNYCPKAHVLNTSDLEDFVVKSVKTLSQGLKNIEAVTGVEAAKTRKTDAEFEDRWLVLRKKKEERKGLDLSQVDESLLQFERLKTDLQNSKSSSFVVKTTLVQEVEDAGRNLRKFRETIANQPSSQKRLK